MESLSIKKTGKVFLAVALVIFMLVALLGLSIYGHTATAAAEDADLVITATFSGASHTPHSDSTDYKKYYNESSLALVPNTDTFTVTYTFAVKDGVDFTGAKYLDLTNTGFEIVSVTVNGVNLTTNKTTTIASGDGAGIYTMSADGKSRIGFDGNGNIMDKVAPITVVYKLTSAIDPYSNATIGLTGKYSVLRKTLQNVASSTVGVYVRSTTGITTTAADKTYDASAETTSTTFTAAVSTGKPADPAITTVWKTSADAVLGDAPIDAGDYKVTVSTPATNDFEATTYTKSFTISKRAVTITADNKTSVYSTSPVALSYTYSESGAWTNFADRDSVTVTYTGAGASISTATTVGDYTITPVASNANYTITPVNGTYTVTRHNVAVPTVTIYNNGVATDTTITAGTTEKKTFNGKAYTFDYTAASADANSILPYEVSGGSAITNVGTSTLTLTLNANYYWGAANVEPASQDQAATKTFTIEVEKKNITIYLHHAAITYRDAVPTTGYTLGDDDNGLDNGENLASISLTQSDFSTTYNVGSPVGTYDIAVAEDSASRTAIETFLSNYNVSYDGEDLLSVGKLTVTATNDWIAYTDSASVIYNKAAHGIVAVPSYYTMSHSDTSAVICDVALSGGDNSNGTQTHVSGDEAAVTLTAVFTLKGDSATDDYDNVITANYTLAEGTQTKNITITRKAVTITAGSDSITYGDAAPTYTSDANSVLISGDTYATEGSVTSAYRAVAENSNRVVGSYDIVPAGWANNDYAISYVNGTLTVGKKTVSITWSTPNTWIYDGSAHIVTATIGDTEYSEAITAAAYDTDTELTNVGSSSRSVTSLSDNGNYAIPENSQAFSVTARTVTVAVTPASNFTYDSASHTIFTVVVSNLVGTEDLTFAYNASGYGLENGSAKYANGSYTFAGELAGDYALVFTGITNGDNGLAANYSFTPADSESMTIAKYTFTVGDITYSGATATWVAPTTIQDGDEITFAYSLKLGGVEKLASNTATTYTATETGVYTLSVSFSGDRAANYNTIADQDLLEVFSVTLNDAAYNDATYGHPHNGARIDAVTQYAFNGQTVPGVSDWSVAGYQFNGWFLNYADTTTGAFNASNAVTATATYTASWEVVKYNVTYKYKLADAESWETYKSNVETTYWTALETVPSITWFSNVGWNDAEAMNGATKEILDYTSDRTYYTVYTFAVKNGDVDGNGEVTAADATLYRQVNVGGYAVDDHIIASIAAAWTEADKFSDGTYTFSFTADKYFLQPVADVDADGQESTNDIFYIVNAQVTKSYADLEDGAVIIKIAELTDGTTVAIPATPTAVKVAGADALYTYNDGVLTLNTALTSGQKLEVIINRVKYVYQA